MKSNVPPTLFSLSSEQSIIGGILVRGGEAFSLLGDLRTEHFFDLRHQAIYSALRSVHESGDPIDSVTVENRLAKSDLLVAAGGIAYLGECALRVPTVDNISIYSGEVKAAWGKRKALEALDRAKIDVVGDYYRADQALEEAAGVLTRISVDSVPDRIKPNKWCRGLSALLGDHEPDDDDREDWIIRDLIPRQAPTLFAGPAKAGKTTSALDLAISIALGQDWLGFEYCPQSEGCRVLVICTEDGERRLRKRIWELCRSRSILPYVDRLMKNLDVCTQKINLPSSEDENRLGAELRNWGAQVCIVDNLTRIMIGDPNKTKDAAELSRAWYRLGDLSGATIVLLHHTKKDDGQARDRDPFESIKGNGDFVAAARMAILAVPVRSEENAEIRTTEFRMRGNFDLRTEGFALGYERRMDSNGRWMTQISNRGSMSDIKVEMARANRENRYREKVKEAELEDQRRASLAIALATRNGTVSCVQLATALGLRSDRSVAPILNELVASGRLVRAGKAGYGLPAHQGEIPQIRTH